MKIQFESNQQFQLDAIQSTLDVFDGQPLAQGEYEIRFDAVSGEIVTHLGVGNRLALDPSTLLANVQKIQKRNEIKTVSEALDGMHFSVEMETGTGKTYVYLRTIFELNRTYGFQKFVIVVPSVAIREGVLKNIEITARPFPGDLQQRAVRALGLRLEEGLPAAAVRQQQPAADPRHQHRLLQ